MSIERKEVEEDELEEGELDDNIEIINEGMGFENNNEMNENHKERHAKYDKHLDSKAQPHDNVNQGKSSKNHRKGESFGRGRNERKRKRKMVEDHRATNNDEYKQTSPPNPLKEPYNQPQDPHHQPQEPHYPPQEPHHPLQEPHYPPQEPHHPPQEPHHSSQEPHHSPHHPPQEPHHSPHHPPHEPHHLPQETNYPLHENKTRRHSARRYEKDEHSHHSKAKRPRPAIERTTFDLTGSDGGDDGDFNSSNEPLEHDKTSPHSSKKFRRDKAYAPERYDSEYDGPHSNREGYRGGRFGRPKGRFPLHGKPPRKGPSAPESAGLVCKYFLEGKCLKRENCTYVHDMNPPKRRELCRYYLTNRGCNKGICFYYHGEWPCKEFHSTGSCVAMQEDRQCQFSHHQLNDETRSLLLVPDGGDGSNSFRKPSFNENFNKNFRDRKFEGNLSNNNKFNDNNRSNRFNDDSYNTRNNRMNNRFHNNDRFDNNFREVEKKNRFNNDNYGDNSFNDNNNNKFNNFGHSPNPKESFAASFGDDKSIKKNHFNHPPFKNFNEPFNKNNANNNRNFNHNPDDFNNHDVFDHFNNNFNGNDNKINNNNSYNYSTKFNNQNTNNPNINEPREFNDSDYKVNNGALDNSRLDINSQAPKHFPQANWEEDRKNNYDGSGVDLQHEGEEIQGKSPLERVSLDEKPTKNNDHLNKKEDFYEKIDDEAKNRDGNISQKMEEDNNEDSWRNIESEMESRLQSERDNERNKSEGSQSRPNLLFTSQPPPNNLLNFTIPDTSFPPNSMSLSYKSLIPNPLGINTVTNDNMKMQQPAVLLSPTNNITPFMPKRMPFNNTLPILQQQQPILQQPQPILQQQPMMQQQQPMMQQQQPILQQQQPMMQQQQPMVQQQQPMMQQRPMFPLTPQQQSLIQLVQQQRPLLNLSQQPSLLHLTPQQQQPIIQLAQQQLQKPLFQLGQQQQFLPQSSAQQQQNTFAGLLGRAPGTYISNSRNQFPTLPPQLDINQIITNIVRNSAVAALNSQNTFLPLQLPPFQAPPENVLNESSTMAKQQVAEKDSAMDATMEAQSDAGVENNEGKDQSSVESIPINNIKPVSDPRLKNPNNQDLRTPRHNQDSQIIYGSPDDEDACVRLASPDLEKDGTVASVKYELRRLTGDIQRPTIPIEMIANLKLKGNDKETRELLERDPRLTQYSKPTLKTLDLNFAEKIVDSRNQFNSTEIKPKFITTPPSLIFSTPPSTKSPFSVHSTSIILSPNAHDIFSPQLASSKNEKIKGISDWRIFDDKTTKDKSVKKVIDYRNDPRYKRKSKVKSAEDNSEGSTQAITHSEDNKSTDPTQAAYEPERISSTEVKLPGSSETTSYDFPVNRSLTASLYSSSSPNPTFPVFCIPGQYSSKPLMAAYTDTSGYDTPSEPSTPIREDDDDDDDVNETSNDKPVSILSGNFYSSTQSYSSSPFNVHTSTSSDSSPMVTNTETVPTLTKPIVYYKSLDEDCEREKSEKCDEDEKALSIKDMFKSIDPTNSPFC